MIDRSVGSDRKARKERRMERTERTDNKREGTNVVALSKARCNGDFCTFHADMEKSELQNQAVEETKDKYIPWKAKDAKKNEWKLLQDEKTAGVKEEESKAMLN